MFGMCWRECSEVWRPGSDYRPIDRCPQRNHLWAERYDRDLKDLFALQDEITHKDLERPLQVKLAEGGMASIRSKILIRGKGSIAI